MRFILLTGMSGAGKSVALRHLEDLGAFCIDNLPPMLMLHFMQACQKAEMERTLVAMAVDVRSGEFFDAVQLTKNIQEARESGYTIETIFFDAADHVLFTRYKETRRDHPLASGKVGLQEAITSEREKLQPIREQANYIIDTSALNPKVLKKMLSDILLSGECGQEMNLEITSFGYKRGIPRESDLVLDVRFLPNPFYIPELGTHVGLEDCVKDFVLKSPVTQEFLQKAMDLLTFLLPHYRQEGKHRLVLAIGCTGGAHRSVAIAEEISRRLREKGEKVDCNHRDLMLEKESWKNM